MRAFPMQLVLVTAQVSEVDDCSMNDGAVLYTLPLHTFGLLIVHSIVYFITQAFQLTLQECYPF